MRCQAVGSVAQQKGRFEPYPIGRQDRKKVGSCPSLSLSSRLGKPAVVPPSHLPTPPVSARQTTDATPGLGHLGWTLSSSLPSAASPPPGTWHPARPHPAPTPGFRTTTPPSYKPCGSRCPFRPRPLGPASHARAHTHTRPSPFALTDLSGPSSSPAPE